jgi:hypothetical protein
VPRCSLLLSVVGAYNKGYTVQPSARASPKFFFRFATEKLRISLTLDKSSLGGLIDLIGNVALGSEAAKSKDILGKVDNFDFAERFTTLKSELEEQIKKEAELNKRISENLAKIEYEK